MTELKERFSLADEIDTRDLWGEARRRAAAPQAPPRAVEWPPAAGRRVAAAAVALAVFATAAVFAWDLSHPASIPAPEPGVDLGSELPEGWSELPAPPENRSGAATAWTGTEFLVWGGHEFVGHGDEDPDRDGYSFNAVARTWGPLPQAPLGGRSDPAFAWTGEELLIWGGFDGGFRDVPYFDDGAAFDPATRTWRMLPPAPIEARTAFSVWTGREFLVWGSTNRSHRLRDGAAYDPTSNTWRTIADGPTDITDGSAAWTGREMIVFGAALDGNNHADTRTAIGVAYEPAADSWRELPPSDLSPQAMTAEWLGTELIAWDYDQASAAYDPGTDSWRPLERVPLAFSECRPVSVALGRTVFGEFCGKTVVFSPREDAWHRDQMPVPDAEGGCCWVHEPVAAGDVVLVPSHLYDEPPQRETAVDRRMFVYTPPGEVRTDPTGEVLEPARFLPSGAERDGDLIRLPVVFPDGSRATLVYPIPLDLATLRIQPDVSYLWRQDPPPRFPIVFLHDPNASIERYVEGDAPIGTLGSGFELWNAADRLYGLDHQTRFHLVTRLPEWTVLVAMRDQLEAEEVRASLRIRVTADGFPVVSASGPLALARGFGEAEGAQLAFGDAAAEPNAVSQLDAIIFLSPDGCPTGREISPSGEYGSSCLANGNVFASIYGDRAFVTAVVEGLRVENFRPA